MRERHPCVYLLASGLNGTLYVGVTSHLAARLYQHRHGTTGFASRHRAHRLVHFEIFDDMANAIAREKQLKGWHRDWKKNLIERENPRWDDLAVGLGLIDGGPGPAVDAETSSA